MIVIGGGSAGLEAAMRECSAGLGSSTDPRNPAHGKRKVALIAKGRSLEDIDYSPFVQAGGILMLGDTVVEGNIAGGRVTLIRTENLGRTALEADLYILATGKYFGGGLVADMEGIREPLFGLDVLFTKDNWFDADFFAPQPFMTFGVKTDAQGHPYKDGVKIVNLLAVGDICAG